MQRCNIVSNLSRNKCNFQQQKIEFPTRLIAEAIPVNGCHAARRIRVPSRAFRKRIPETVPPPIIPRHSISGISSGTSFRRRVSTTENSPAFLTNKTRQNDFRAFQSEIGIFTNNEGKRKFYSRIKDDLLGNVKIYSKLKCEYKLFAIACFKMKA